MASAWMSFDLLVIWFIGFVVYVDYTIYLPTMLPYIQTLTESDEKASTVLSIAYSLSALSQVSFSLVSGVLGSRLGVRNVLVAFQLCAVSGTVVYTLAGEDMLDNVWLIVTARILIGAEGGVVGLCMSYISKNTADQNTRLIGISNFRAICIFAAIPASLIAMLLTIDPLQFEVFGWYEFNEMTSPAWFVLVLQSLAIVSVLTGIKAEPREEEGEQETQSSSLYFSLGVGVLFVILFYNGFIVSSTAFIMPVVIIEQFGWTAAQYSPVVFGLSIAGVAGSMFAKGLGNRLFQGRQQLIVVPSIALIGLFVFSACAGSVLVSGPTGLPETLFIVGVLGTFLMYSIEMAVVSTVFSQIIPRRSLVSMMPLTTSLFAIGKILGPVWSEMEINRVGKGLLFFTMMTCTLVVLFFSVCFSSKYQATSIEVVDDDDAGGMTSDSSTAETGLFDEEYEYLKNYRGGSQPIPSYTEPQEAQPAMASSLGMDIAVAAWDKEQQGAAAGTGSSPASSYGYSLPSARVAASYY